MARFGPVKRALFAGLAALASVSAPVPAAAQPPARPTLIVVVAVDQFSADLFAQYRQHFGGGLGRLSRGMVFPAGYQSHASTETCPGHATLLTGARPARTGIVANNWYDFASPRQDKSVYCAEDESVPGSSFENYLVSPVHLRVPTLGDLMRRADPRSRVVAIAGKDRAAIMMGGHGPSQRWWWNGRTFASHAEVAEPAAVRETNARVAEALGRAREPMPVPEVCEPRRRAIPIAGRAEPIGTGSFGRAAADRSAWRASPEADAAVLGLAVGFIEELRLGRGDAPDLIAVGLSATDYIGHTYGTEGLEMCVQLLALDRALGDFFTALDRERIDYAVVLTADHGGLDLPERARDEAGGDAARIDPALGTTAMGEAIGAELGLAGPALLGEGGFGDFYIDRALPAAARQRVLAAALARYRAHPQVAAVFTRAEIEAAAPPSGPPDSWTLIQRAQASYDPRRSGDFYVILKPRITPISNPGRGYVATHGSPWDYDRRVPILFWRRGATPFEQPLAVETVDIMPTLAGLIGLPLAPGSIDGRCLDLDPGPASTCPPGR